MDNQQSPTDRLDTVREVTNMLAKLTPDIDGWAIAEGTPTETQVIAARMIAKHAQELRSALFAVEYMAQRVIEAHDERKTELMARFFDEEEPA